jgi:hypothetical protein
MGATPPDHVDMIMTWTSEVLPAKLSFFFEKGKKKKKKKKKKKTLKMK